MPKNFTYYSSAESIDPDAILYYTAAGITSNIAKSAVNKLVKSFKASGVWNNLEAAYPLLADKKNHLTYTEDFSNAAWGKVAVTATSVVQANPVGSSCYNIVPSTGNTWHYLSRQLPLTMYADGVYTLSIYAKANGYDWLRFVVEDGAGGYARVWFDVANGVSGSNGFAGGVTLYSFGIQPESDGFYRITISIFGGFRPLLIWISPSSADAQGGTWIGDGTSGILVTGAQLELAASVSLTTYEPVTSSLMAPQMMYNLKNPLNTDAAHRIVWNNTSGGFTKMGYTISAALGNWGDIKLDPATYLLQDNAHLSITSSIDYGLTALWIDFGLFDSTGVAPSFHITPGFSTQGMRVRVNSSIATALQFNPNTVGTFMGNRVNSSDIELYVDGVLVSTEAAVSTGLSALSMYIGGINQNGVINVIPARRLTFATVGKGLTPAQALAMKNAITTFNTTLNR